MKPERRESIRGRLGGRLNAGAGSLCIYASLIGWAIISGFPLVFMLLMSLKDDAELYRSPFGLPHVLRWSNFADAWTEGFGGSPERHYISPCLINSAEVTLLSLLLAMTISMMCAFAFARLRFGPLKTLIWTYVMFGFLVPDSVRFFPLMVYLTKLGLYDNVWGLVLIYAAAGVPFNTFLLRAFMERIPADYEDAAVVDGASIWQVFWNVIVPLSRAPLVTLATFHTMAVWNEFLMAYFLTSSETARTLPVGVRMLRGVFTTNDTALAAGLVVVMVPMMIFFILFQRQVVKGLTAGALVG